jgi:hypothetical protein
MVGHRKCAECSRIGHMADMVRDKCSGRWQHRDCTRPTYDQPSLNERIDQLLELHQVCAVCGEVGHKPDMVQEDREVGHGVKPVRVWVHKTCASKPDSD